MHGACFDIGIATRQALARYERTRDPFAGSTASDTAGNGSLMRLAPVAIATLDDPGEAERIAEAQGRTTHGAPQAVEACAYFVQLLRGAIRGEAAVLRPRPWIGVDTDGLRPRHWSSAANDDLTPMARDAMRRSTRSPGWMAGQGARRNPLVGLRDEHARGGFVGGRLDGHVRGRARAGGQSRRRRRYGGGGDRPARRGSVRASAIPDAGFILWLGAVRYQQLQTRSLQQLKTAAKGRFR